MAAKERKTMAQVKEEQKKKKNKIKWICITVALVIFFAFVIYVDTGAYYRNMTGYTVSYEANDDIGIPAGERSFTVAECNYFYNAQYMSLLNSYGDYISILGLDRSKPLDEQACTITGKEDYTWDNYFRDNAKETMKQLAVMEAYAKVNKISLTDEDTKAVDEQIKSFESAKDYGYASAGKYISANYGKGTNLSVVRDMMELQQLAAKGADKIASGYSFSSSELAKEYETVKDSYDKFTYNYYLVAAETEKSEDGTAAAPTDEAISKAETTANNILKNVSGDTTLENAVKAHKSDAEIVAQKDIAGSQLESELQAWLVSSERKAGDKTVIKGATGAYIVEFTSRDNNKHKTDESGDMNYCDYIAQQLLQNEKANELITKAAEGAKAKSAFGARYVGK